MKTAIVFGGKSSEYKVSLHSAASFLQHISDLYDLILIGIDETGHFYEVDSDIDPKEIEEDRWLEKAKPGVFVPGGFYSDTYIPVDIVFPVVHGKNGEDGTLQGLFELYNIPYVGCDVASSANCMDKEIMHRLVDLAGIEAAPYITIKENQIPDFEQVQEQIALPWIIKPARAGSSYGVSYVDKKEDYKKAVEQALFYDGRGKALIEKAIDGFEIGTAVLEKDTGKNRELIVGECDEIETARHFFDYEGKYAFEEAAIHCPARITKEQSDKAKALAREIFELLECKGLARIDFFIDKEGKILLNEVNTIPGLTAFSRYPSMMKEAGLSFDQVIDILIETGLHKKVGAC